MGKVYTCFRCKAKFTSQSQCYWHIDNLCPKRPGVNKK
jgi:DNA-directed RNA polymerase subunit RPC12/RpoP